MFMSLSRFIFLFIFMSLSPFIFLYIQVFKPFYIFIYFHAFKLFYIFIYYTSLSPFIILYISMSLSVFMFFKLYYIFRKKLFINKPISLSVIFRKSTFYIIFPSQQYLINPGVILRSLPAAYILLYSFLLITFL